MDFLRGKEEDMKKRNRVFVIYCLFALCVFAIALCSLAGCKKSTLKQTQNTALSPEQKISQYSNPNALISVSELNDIIKNPNLKIIDARCYGIKDYRQLYPAGQIPGAIAVLRGHYQDPNRWNRISPPNIVKWYLGGLGIDSQDRIVIYGNDNGLQARFYWMLKMYGCNNEIQILDGGFEKWKEAGNQTSSDINKRQPLARFEFNQVKADGSFVAYLNDMGEAASGNNSNNIIVDARSSSEYDSMHIPGSVNITVDDIMNSDKTFKAANELTAVFTAKGVTPDKNVYVYSNVGSRSSLIWFTLHELMDYPNVRNYDAGLREWRYRERPVE